MVTRSHGMLLTGALVVLAATPAIAGPKGDSVKGHGENNPPDASRVASFEIDARSDADGANPNGKVRFKTRSTGAITAGDVSCLRVVGKLAVIGVDLTKVRTSDPGPYPNAMLVYVEDNGNKKAGADEIRSATQTLDAPVTDCPAPMNPDRMPLMKGDIRVDDN